MDEFVYPVMGDTLWTICMYRNAHGNDMIKYQDAMCSLFEQHVDKAHKRTVIGEIVFELH